MRWEGEPSSIVMPIMLLYPHTRRDEQEQVRAYVGEHACIGTGKPEPS